MKTKYSFEVFPPRKEMPAEVIYKTLDELTELKPEFISVTCGAGGTATNASERMIEIAKAIKEKYKRESVAHMPCMNIDREEAKKILEELESAGIKKILALRGDKVANVEPKGEFNHAIDLIKYIRREKGEKVEIYAACYPEGHTEAEDLETDIRYLKEKVEAGVDGLITQLFFDNESYYYFMEKIRKEKIEVPVEAGIMPVTNKKQIERMVKICGAKVPVKLRKIIDKYGEDKEAMREAGIIYAQNQITELLTNGAEGIHLYVMNNVYVAKKISSAIEKLLEVE